MKRVLEPPQPVKQNSRAPVFNDPASMGSLKLTKRHLSPRFAANESSASAVRQPERGMPPVVVSSGKSPTIIAESYTAQLCQENRASALRFGPTCIRGQFRRPQRPNGCTAPDQ